MWYIAELSAWEQRRLNCALCGTLYCSFCCHSEIYILLKALVNVQKFVFWLKALANIQKAFILHLENVGKVKSTCILTFVDLENKKTVVRSLHFSFQFRSFRMEGVTTVVAEFLGLTMMRMLSEIVAKSLEIDFVMRKIFLTAKWLNGYYVLCGSFGMVVYQYLVDAKFMQ